MRSRPRGTARSWPRARLGRCPGPAPGGRPRQEWRRTGRGRRPSAARRRRQAPRPRDSHRRGRAATRSSTVPAACRTVPRGTPRGTSSTPGCARIVGVVPLIVARKVPGSDGVPTERNHPAPLRAISASWARVSALSTSVGRPSTPRRKTGTSGSDGTPGRPSSWLTSADSWPATNPPDAASRTSTRVPRAAWCAGCGGHLRSEGEDEPLRPERRAEQGEPVHDQARVIGRAAGRPCR